MKQKRIPGTFDPVPKAVEEAAAEYLKHKRAVAKGREKMNASLEDLIAKMRKADVVEMLVDDGEKILTLSAEDKIKVKARKRAKKKEGGTDEDHKEE